MKVTEPQSGSFTSFQFGIYQSGDPNPDKKISDVETAGSYVDYKVSGVKEPSDNKPSDQNPSGDSQTPSGDPSADSIQAKTPAKVRGLASTGTKTNALTFTRNASESADGYRLALYQGKKKVKEVTTAKTTYTFKKLKKLTVYSVKIEACAKAGDKDLVSETVTLKTATSPAKVSVKSVKKAGTGKIRISWKRVKGADGYEILVKAGKGKYKCVKTIGKGKTLSFTFGKAKKGMKYSVKVRSFKKVGKTKVYGADSGAKTLKMK